MVRVHDMKACIGEGGIALRLHLFITSAVDVGEWLTLPPHRPGHFAAWKGGGDGKLWICGWVDTRAVLDGFGGEKIFPPQNESKLQPPVHG